MTETGGYMVNVAHDPPLDPALPYTPALQATILCLSTLLKTTDTSSENNNAPY